jgi:MerR family transcriptional regulator/heat shock protein HspR
MSVPDWGCDVEQQDQHAVYVISVAAELAGVHPQTLRIYERKGLINPARTAGRSRRYSEADISTLRRIQELTTAGVGLPGVARILQLEARLAQMQAELDRVREQAEAAIADAHRQYRRDLVPVPRPGLPVRARRR